MEVKILNSILFKELMPWAFDVKGIKAINEKIKKVGLAQSQDLYLVF